MDWREKLRSFPVIAALVIAAAIVLGILLGLMGSKPRPVPVGGVEAEQHRPSGPAVKTGTSDATTSTPRDNTASSASNNPRPGDAGRKPRETSPADKPRTGGQAPAGVWSRPKELAPGKKDNLQARVDTPVAQSSLLVTVKTPGEYAASQAAIFLDIQADGIGWQRINAKAQATTNPAEWRFANLHAGTYLVTVVIPGYNTATQTVLVPGGMQEIAVRFDIGQPQYGRVLFSFAFEDGGRPEQVFCNRVDKGGRDNVQVGRFGRRDNLPITQGALGGGLGNYAIPQDSQTLIFAMLVGHREEYVFSAVRDTRRYTAQITVTGRAEEQRHEMLLKLLDPAAPDPTGGFFSKEPVKATFTFQRSDQGPVKLRRCNLRPTPEAATYTAASTLDGAKATFLAVQPGSYYLVAEAEAFAAAYVTPVTVSAQTELTFTIELANLSITVLRDPAASPPQNTRLSYRASLRPLSSGSLETFYNHEIPKDAASHSASYFVPVGAYSVVMGSTDPLLACEPPLASITVTRDGAALTFTLRTASTLEFVCVDVYMNPVPGVEFLVSYSPAGQIPDSDRPRVELGGPDGRCVLKGATYGRVYLHIWVASTDFQAPDRTFEIDLPAYGVLNLGSVTVK